MNTPLPPEHDDELSGEAELAALYRKLPRSEPSPALDSSVLRAAAEALSSSSATPSTVPNARKPGRWFVPLSSAATLVLAAGLAWHMREMPVAEHVAAKVDATPAASASTASGAVAPMRDQAAAPPSPQMAPPPPPQPVAMTEPTRPSARPSADVAERAQTAHQPAPPLPRAPSAARMSKPYIPGLVAKAYKPDEATQPQDKPASAVAANEPSRSVREHVAESPASPAQADAAKQVSGSALRPIPAGRAADAEAPSALDAAPAPLQETAAVPEQEGSVADRDDTVRASAAASRIMVAPALHEFTARNASDTPAQELQKIRLLFAHHHDDEAQARLTAFQREHPDEALPADLRAHLPDPP